MFSLFDVMSGASLEMRALVIGGVVLVIVAAAVLVAFVGNSRLKRRAQAGYEIPVKGKKPKAQKKHKAGKNEPMFGVAAEPLLSTVVEPRLAAPQQPPVAGTPAAAPRLAEEPQSSPFMPLGSGQDDDGDSSW
jgi:DNA binding protein S1FA